MEYVCPPPFASVLPTHTSPTALPPPLTGKEGRSFLPSSAPPQDSTLGALAVHCPGAGALCGSDFHRLECFFELDCRHRLEHGEGFNWPKNEKTHPWMFLVT